jgi:2-polyprenyl-3-methyl-5-hydroxy-6-metoxy-1,4-benzoquinol methylase
MRIFRTPPYKNVQELLDRAGEASEHDLEETLRDIRRANIFGLGTWVVKHHLAGLVSNIPKDRKLTILDLATGSADIPEELCRWARSEGREIEIVATDISPEILEVARKRIAKAGFANSINFLACSATDPPFPGKSFDVVTCSLAFHHLELGQAQDAMKEMARLSRQGFIINDIYRSQGAWFMAWFLARITSTNRLTHHDGPASVYRAFTPAEMQRMSRNVGLCAQVFRHPLWRMAVVASGKTGS